ASENIPSIVEAWQLGTESGNAIADVLLGKYNPSGKLPVSFPRAVGQEPLYYNHLNTGRPYSEEHVTYAHYTDIENGPLYPFGYGLSYTDFEYGKPELSSSSLNTGETVTLSVELTNTGNVKGKEVVQLYLRDLVASLARPVKELKGFQLVELNPGETRTVEFQIDEEMLKFYSASGKWEAETGEFELMLGGNSEDVKSVKLNYSKS
ncbi:MAG: fibronectin type III-like domain-contianing protein, partial [Christiangramia sp.]|nr:fibronectin type III-like domain-contianing protein [Christiangramia sp.]